MIKDKDGNRVNFIRKFSYSQSYGPSSPTVNFYNYTTQIKKQDGNTIWAAPACICLPMANSMVSDYITCKVTKMSEPKPQRINELVNEAIRAGEYIYCGEIITMDCTNSLYKEDYCSSYLFDGDSNLINGFMSVPKLPKDFSFDLTAGYTNIADSSKYYNNNTDIVEDGGGNPRVLKLSASDFEGAIWFSSGTRPAFTGSGNSYKLSWSIYPTTNSSTVHTWKNIEDLYDGGTFELTNPEKKYTGTITAKRTQTGGGSNPPYTFSLTLTSTQPIAARTGGGNEIGITLKPKSTASALKQNDVACIPTDGTFQAVYGIDSSIFGESDWYIEREDVYTTGDGTTQSYSLYLCGTNKRLYSYGIEPVKLVGTTSSGKSVTINLNQQGGGTEPGKAYRILLHQLDSYSSDIASLTSFTLYYKFLYDTNYEFFIKNLTLSVPSDKITDQDVEISA